MEPQIQALLSALAGQRNQALDKVAELSAQMLLMQRRIEELEAAASTEAGDVPRAA